jgi:hypothetical protein
VLVAVRSLFSCILLLACGMGWSARHRQGQCACYVGSRLSYCVVIGVQFTHCLYAVLAACLLSLRRAAVGPGFCIPGNQVRWVGVICRSAMSCFYVLPVL